MKVAAVGGGGFVGRHVVRRLTAAGICVITVDSRPPVPVPGEQVVRQDLLSAGGPESAAGMCGPLDAVVWLAAPARHRVEVDGGAPDDMAAMVEAPVRFLRSLISPPASLVYLSSIQVYGLPQRLPVDEDHATNPVTSYGAAKLCAEHYLRIASTGRFCFMALRVAFVYGPGQHPGNAIPIFLEAVRRGDPPTVLGTGDEVRDDVYVGDLARAVEMAITNPVGGAFNIASGRPHTLLHVAQEACRLGKPGLRPRHQGGGGGWIDRTFAVERARAVLGFEATTPFREGLREQWRSLAEPS